MDRKVIIHGAALVLLGLLLGLAAVAEELARAQPLTWRPAHGALLLAGVWLLAVAAVLPQLVLPPGQRRALCWSLLIAADAFTVAVLIQAITGVRALSPSGTVTSWVAYGANIVTVGAGMLAALLTLLGAIAGHKENR